MLDSSEQTPPAHFNGKEAVGHVIEAQARGLIAQAENHAHEIPGHLSAATDAARDTALLFTLLWILLFHLGISWQLTWQSAALLCGSWLVWRAGRSAMLGWNRLERLHRVLQEEKWEIEHHRKQERDELKALYAAKGFEGKLLEDVMDVLMADNDRLLRIMVEEELGLTLEKHEHPLQQSLGAAIGSATALAFCLLLSWIAPHLGPIIATILITAAASLLATYYEQNRLIPALVWNVGLISLPLAFVYFLITYLKASL